MKILNAYGLPESLVQAVRADDYDRGASDFTVTELVSPPQVVQLRRRHHAEIEVDVADRLWLLLGKVAHGILQRADMRNALTEERLYATIEGQRVSGQFDRVVMTPEDVLQDYKITSVWALKDGPRADWCCQLNLYAELLRRHSFEPKRLEIVPLYRDHRRGEALKNHTWYPEKPMGRPIPVPLWPTEQAVAYLHARVQLHSAAARVTETLLPECSAAERWKTETVYAVYKGTNKNATKLCPTLAAAEEFVHTLPPRTEIRIMERPGRSIRCADYCEVAPWCGQWLAEQAAAPPLPAAE